MLEIQKKYNNIFSFILAILFAAIITFIILPLRYLNNIDGFLELQVNNLVYSNFISSIIAKPSPNEFFTSLILLTFLSLFFLFYRIKNKYNWLFCAKTAIYVGTLFILLNNNLNDIFYFICYINIVSSFYSVSRFAQFALLMLTIILSPIFSIVCLVVLYLTIKIIKLNIFYVYRNDLVLVDSFFFSIVVLFFIYGFQWVGLFLYPLLESSIFFIIKFFILILSALPILLSRKSYES